MRSLVRKTGGEEILLLVQVFFCRFSEFLDVAATVVPHEKKNTVTRHVRMFVGEAHGATVLSDFSDLSSFFC